MLRILGRLGSINVRKVLWVADELGIEYEREDWGVLGHELNQPSFLALNPNAQIPVLIDDGFVLWESHAIMHYLIDKAGGHSLLPTDDRERALVEQWLGWQATDLNFSWRYAVSALKWKAPGFDDPQRLADSLAEWAEKMAVLEAQLRQTGRYILGDRLTVADISLGVSVHRWFEVSKDVPEMPACHTYRERLRTETRGGPYLTPATS